MPFHLSGSVLSRRKTSHIIYHIYMVHLDKCLTHMNSIWNCRILFGESEVFCATLRHAMPGSGTKNTSESPNLLPRFQTLIIDLDRESSHLTRESSLYQRNSRGFPRLSCKQPQNSREREREKGRRQYFRGVSTVRHFSHCIGPLDVDFLTPRRGPKYSLERNKNQIPSNSLFVESIDSAVPDFLLLVAASSRRRLRLRSPFLYLSTADFLLLSECERVGNRHHRPYS